MVISLQITDIPPENEKDSIYGPQNRDRRRTHYTTCDNMLAMHAVVDFSHCTSVCSFSTYQIFYPDRKSNHDCELFFRYCLWRRHDFYWCQIAFSVFVTYYAKLHSHIIFPSLVLIVEAQLGHPLHLTKKQEQTLPPQKKQKKVVHTWTKIATLLDGYAKNFITMILSLYHMRLVYQVN